MELVRCQKCEAIEAQQVADRATRQQLFMDGALSQQQDESLDLEESRIIGILKDHQALEHDHDKVYEGQLPRD